MEFLAENLAAALDAAIEKRTAEEKELGYSVDSAQLAGWKELRCRIMEREIAVITLRF